MGHELCKRWHLLNRDEAKRKKVVIPSLHWTKSNLGRGSYYFITDSNGKPIWEGYACCVSEARAAAVAILIGGANEN